MIEVRITIDATQDLRDLLALAVDALRAAALKPLATANADAWNAWATSAPVSATATAVVRQPDATRASTFDAGPRHFGNEAWKWSAERKELALRLSEEGVPRKIILARVNALPGDPIVGVDAMSAKLASLRKKAREAAAAPRSVTGEPEVEPEPERPSAPADAPQAAPVAEEPRDPEPSKSAAAARPVRLPSAFPAPVAAAARAPLPPIEVDAETALRYGAERGLDPLVLDLDAVNRKRVFHGQPPYVLRPRPAPRPPLRAADPHTA